MAYEELEPEDAGDDVRFAHLMALVAQVAGNKNAKLSDFLPQHLKPRPLTPYQAGMALKAKRQAQLADMRAGRSGAQADTHRGRKTKT